MCKRIVFAVIVLLAFTLIGCAKNEEVNRTSEIKTARLKNVGVKSDDDTVVIMVPKDFVNEGMTQDDFNKIAEDKGYTSIIFNNDGSVTYTMSKEQHNEMIKGLSLNINKTLEEMTQSENYLNIESIIPNETYTEFEIKINAEKVEIDDSVIVVPLYTYGEMYNIFNGTQTPSVKVRFFNSKTGALISEADSANVGR